MNLDHVFPRNPESTTNQQRRDVHWYALAEKLLWQNLVVFAFIVFYDMVGHATYGQLGLCFVWGVKDTDPKKQTCL
jgi:hypothetical protein